MGEERHAYPVGSVVKIVRLEQPAIGYDMMFSFWKSYYREYNHLIGKYVLITKQIKGGGNPYEGRILDKLENEKEYGFSYTSFMFKKANTL
jgi:hypothetical protein